MAFNGLLQKILLQESATPEQVCKAIDNHSYVIINYHTDGKDDSTGSRAIIPVAYGLTKASNPVVRAYQPFGDSTTMAKRWKFFRLDRISYWEETKKKFHREDIPDTTDNIGDFNENGDDLMQVVNYVVKFGNDVNATGGVTNGPKTKEKVAAVSKTKVARTSGDKIVDLGYKNIKNQEASIKVDIDNNRKANGSFNVYTDNTPTDAGPREPDKSYKPRNVSGTPDKKDVRSGELDRLRDKVNNADRSSILNNDELWNTAENEPEYVDYMHNWDDDEIAAAKFDQRVMNREPWQNKNLSASRRKWERYANGLASADRMFKNRADSGNRVLYNMDQEKKAREEAEKE